MKKYIALLFFISLFSVGCASKGSVQNTQVPNTAIYATGKSTIKNVVSQKDTTYAERDVVINNNYNSVPKEELLKIVGSMTQKEIARLLDERENVVIANPSFSSRDGKYYSKFLLTKTSNKKIRYFNFTVELSSGSCNMLGIEHNLSGSGLNKNIQNVKRDGFPIGWVGYLYAWDPEIHDDSYIIVITNELPGEKLYYRVKSDAY